jgi:hypothetical protein
VTRIAQYISVVLKTYSKILRLYIKNTNINYLMVCAQGTSGEKRYVEPWSGSESTVWQLGEGEASRSA